MRPLPHANCRGRHAGRQVRQPAYLAPLPHFKAGNSFWSSWSMEGDPQHWSVPHHACSPSRKQRPRSMPTPRRESPRRYCRRMRCPHSHCPGRSFQDTLNPGTRCPDRHYRCTHCPNTHCRCTGSPAGDLPAPRCHPRHPRPVGALPPTRPGSPRVLPGTAEKPDLHPAPCRTA